MTILCHTKILYSHFFRVTRNIECCFCSLKGLCHYCNRSNSDYYYTVNLCMVSTPQSTVGEQVWRSGESTRLPPMWPGLNSRTRRHCCCCCSKRLISGFSCFPLSSKINISKFQLDAESEGHKFVSRDRLLSVTLVKQG